MIGPCNFEFCFTTLVRTMVKEKYYERQDLSEKPSKSRLNGRNSFYCCYLPLYTDIVEADSEFLSVSRNNCCISQNFLVKRSQIGTVTEDTESFYFQISRWTLFWTIFLILITSALVYCIIF
jgi:hypothetical protein